MIRKTGLILVVIVPVLVAGGLYFGRNALVHGLAVYSLERMLGAPVELDGVNLEPGEMRASFTRLRIRSREEPAHYLLVTGPAHFDLNGLQLFARKFVVDDLQVQGLGLGVPCPDCPPLAPAPPPAPTPAAAGESDDGGWSIDLPLPELNLDALKQELDPSRVTKTENLAATKALNQAEADAKARLDAIQQRSSALQDSGRIEALQRQVAGVNLKSKDPRQLKASVETLKDAAAKGKALRNEAQALQRDAQAEPGRVRGGFKAVDKALDEDVAAAIKLAHLGGLQTNQIGELVFGKAVLERFNWVLARVRQVRGMIGSDTEPVQKVPRRTGRVITYPVTGRAYPGFLVQTIAFTGSTTGSNGAEAMRYQGKLTGLSSDTRVSGAPVRLETDATNAKGERWAIRGTFDHRASPGKDVLTAVGQGVHLSDLKLSGGSLPDKATTRDADVNLRFALQGSALDATLRIDANKVRFQFPPGSKAAGEAGRAIRALFADFDRVRLTATLRGTLRKPKVHVSSSIDKQFSARMQALLGKRQKELEAKLRAQIEGAVRAREAELRTQLESRRRELEAQAKRIEAQLAQAQGQLRTAQNQAAGRIKQEQARLEQEQAAAKEQTRKAAEKLKNELKNRLLRKR